MQRLHIKPETVKEYLCIEALRQWLPFGEYVFQVDCIKPLHTHDAKARTINVSIHVGRANSRYCKISQLLQISSLGGDIVPKVMGSKVINNFIAHLRVSRICNHRTVFPSS